jgi:hypothetical protein
VRYPKAWQYAFVDAPGHIGLRREEEWRKMIESAGFELKVWLVESRFPVLDSCPLIQLAMSPHNGRVLQGLGRIIDRLNQIQYVMAIWNVAVCVIDWVTRPVLPKRWGYRLLFVAERA